jgi:hypothetical protein
MENFIVRYLPGASGRFCATIVEACINKEYPLEVGSNSSVHNFSEILPSGVVTHSHNLIEYLIDDYDKVIQVLVPLKFYPRCFIHFFFKCLQKWWDIKLLSQYHPNMSKKELLNLLYNSKFPKIPPETLTAMTDYHKPYNYNTEPYDNKKIHTINYESLLFDPAENLFEKINIIINRQVSIERKNDILAFIEKYQNLSKIEYSNLN